MADHPRRGGGHRISHVGAQLRRRVRRVGDTIDRLRANGGHYLRFGGNLIWQVRLEDEERTQVCHQLAELDPLHVVPQKARTSTHWNWGPIGGPAASAFGISGMQGVYHRFGEAAQIACFELDGAPASLEVLAMTPASRGEEWRYGGPLNAALSDVEGMVQSAPTSYPFSEHGCGMMVGEERGGSMLFNSGTAEWVSGLIAQDEQVEIVTRDVLTRACGSSPAEI